jgi:type I restriction enzyme S subunit
MVCIGTIGKCNLIDRTCAFNQQINSISPYLKISDFLLLALRSKYFQDTAWEKSSSTTIAILNKGKWENIGIPLPPFTEQHRIVAKVDELMALCDELEKVQTNSNTAHETLVEALLGTLINSKNSDDFKEAWERIAAYFDTLFTTEHSIDKLKQTILQLAVMGKLVPQDPNDEPASELLKKIAKEKARLGKDGEIKKQVTLTEVEESDRLFQLPSSWEWVKIGNVGYTQTGGTPSKNDNSLFGNDVPFIKPGDIYPNYVDYTNEGLSLKGVDSLGRFAVEGSILMVCIGTIGKCNLIDRTCAFNQQINSISPYLKISDFLLYDYRVLHLN